MGTNSSGNKRKFYSSKEQLLPTEYDRRTGRIINRAIALANLVVGTGLIAGSLFISDESQAAFMNLTGLGVYIFGTVNYFRSREYN